MENDNDLFYIRKVKAGEISAFTPIVSRYRQLVLTIVCKIVNDREEAEDITQEVFIKVFKHLNKYHEEAAFSTWLYRVAYNTTLSELRKKKVQFTSIDESEAIVNETIDEEYHAEDIENRLVYLDKALKNLSPDDAFIISLHYLDNQSVQAISEVSGLSVANVKVKLHRIRKKLWSDITKMAKDDEL